MENRKWLESMSDNIIVIIVFIVVTVMLLFFGVFVNHDRWTAICTGLLIPSAYLSPYIMWIIWKNAKNDFLSQQKSKFVFDYEVEYAVLLNELLSIMNSPIELLNLKTNYSSINSLQSDFDDGFLTYNHAALLNYSSDISQRLKKICEINQNILDRNKIITLIDSRSYIIYIPSDLKSNDYTLILSSIDHNVARLKGYYSDCSAGEDKGLIKEIHQRTMSEINIEITTINAQINVEQTKINYILNVIFVDK